MIEKVWYEFSPFVYFVVSVFVMFYSNQLAAFFAFFLLLSSLFIGVIRLQSRTKPVANPKHGKIR